MLFDIGHEFDETIACNYHMHLHHLLLGSSKTGINLIKLEHVIIINIFIIFCLLTKVLKPLVEQKFFCIEHNVASLLGSNLESSDL